MFFFSFRYFCKYCFSMHFPKVDLLFSVGDLEKLLNLLRLPPPPSLVGACYLHPRDAHAIFLHSDLLCNGTCPVTGGRITYW